MHLSLVVFRPVTAHTISQSPRKNKPLYNLFAPRYNELINHQEGKHMIRQADIRAVEHLGGGRGTAYVHHIVRDQLMAEGGEGNV